MPSRALPGFENRDLVSSALAEHVFSSKHRVDLSKAMVIDTQPDSLHAGALAHPAPPVPTQQGEVCFARTLFCTTDLTIPPSGVLPLLYYYYYYSFLFFYPLISLVRYLLGCTRLCFIAILILSPPPPFFLLYLSYVMYLVNLTLFCYTHIPHMTTSLSDCLIAFIHACL